MRTNIWRIGCIGPRLIGGMPLFSGGSGAPANNAPTISIGDLAYTENDGAVVLDAAMTVADADNEIESITIEIDTVPDGDAEELTVAGVTIPLGTDESTTGTAGSTGVDVAYTAATRTLVLSKTGGGKWPPGDAQTAGRAATYEHTSLNPTAGARVLTLTVDDGTDTAQDTCTITVTATPAELSGWGDE